MILPTISAIVECFFGRYERKTEKVGKKWFSLVDTPRRVPAFTVVLFVLWFVSAASAFGQAKLFLLRKAMDDGIRDPLYRIDPPG